MIDFSGRRVMMVDTQVRPSDVTKFPIIEAMLSVQREAYVPDAAREAAYMGENLFLAPGRVLLEPRTFAKMLDALDITPTTRVLDVGCGLGGSTAVLARLAAHVTALEEDATLATEARRRLAAEASGGITLVTGPLAAGHPGGAPYDVIVIEGGVETVPDVLTEQLVDGGRIAALFMDRALGVVKIGHRAGGQIDWRFAFNASAPVLPGFVAARGFVL